MQQKPEPCIHVHCSGTLQITSKDTNERTTNSIIRNLGYCLRAFRVDQLLQIIGKLPYYISVHSVQVPR